MGDFRSGFVEHFFAENIRLQDGGCIVLCGIEHIFYRTGNLFPCHNLFYLFREATILRLRLHLISPDWSIEFGVVWKICTHGSYFLSQTCQRV